LTTNLAPPFTFTNYLADALLFFTTTLLQTKLTGVPLCEKGPRVPRAHQPGFPTHLRVGGGHCGARSVCRWGWLPSKRRDSRFFSFSESLSLPSFLSHLGSRFESASTASSSSSSLLGHYGLALCTGRSPPLNTGVFQGAFLGRTSRGLLFLEGGYSGNLAEGSL